MGSSSQARPNFTSYSYGEPSELFYDGYEPLRYGSSSTIPWSQTPQSSGTTRMPHGFSSTLPPPGFARLTGSSSSAPPPGSPPAHALRMKRELSPANPDDDCIDHDGDARHRLSPLSLYRDHRLPLFTFSDEVFPSMGLSDGEKFHHRHHQPQSPGTEECGAPQTRASTSMLSDDDDPNSSPERRPYSAFLDDVLCRWSTSPESVDTDLDDDCSVLSLSMSSSLSSSSLSPPFPDSSEFRRIDEVDEDDDDDEALAISRLDSSTTPLSTTTSEDQDFPQDYEHRYHPIDQYPSQLYNIPTQNKSPRRPQDPSSPPSLISDLQPAERDLPDSDPLQPPSPLDLAPDFQPHPQGRLDASPLSEVQAGDKGEFHHQQRSSPSPPLSSLHSSSPTSPSPPLPRISISSFSLPPASSSAPQGPGFTDESGLDSLGLGFLSPSLSSVGLPSLSSPFYDFGGSPVPESPSRRRSTDLPLLEEDDSDASFSPFSSLFSSPTSEYSDLHHFGQPERQRRAHFLSLPGSDTDDDLIPSELASKNYVPDPTITVPTSSAYFSRSSSEKRARSLLMWDADGSIEYPADGGFGFRGSNYHYPPRSPSPDLLDLDPKKIEELGGGEEGKKIWEARQRAARAETLGDMGFDSMYGVPGEREGVDRRSLGRERRKELSALLRLKLGLIGEKGTAEDDAAQDSKDAASRRALTPSTFAEPSATGTPHSTVDPRPSPSTSVAVSGTSRCPSSTPASSTSTSTSTSTSSARQSSPTSFSKSRITSMAQLVANMVFHRQQHPHSSIGHVHDPSRPKTRTPPPTRSRTWTSGDFPAPGPVLTPTADDSSAPASSPLAKALMLGTAKTPKSPLRQMTLPEELTDDDSSVEDAAGTTGEVHLNKEPSSSSSTLSPLFLCTSPLSFSAGELEAS